jgi:hypothetical protein
LHGFASKSPLIDIAGILTHLPEAEAVTATALKAGLTASA